MSDWVIGLDGNTNYGPRGQRNDRRYVCDEGGGVTCDLWDTSNGHGPEVNHGHVAPLGTGEAPMHVGTASAGGGE